MKNSPFEKPFVSGSVGFSIDGDITLGNKAKGSVGGNDLEGRDLSIKTLTREKSEGVAFSSDFSVTMSDLHLAKVIKNWSVIVIPKNRELEEEDRKEE